MYKAEAYGYFAIKNVKYLDKNDKTGINTSFHINKDDCFYIGIATNSARERHGNHLKPSKYSGKDGQPVNRFLQDNMDSWVFRIIGTIELVIPFNKKMIHTLEMSLIEEFEPKMNVYGRK